tara:strand:+ start:5483 stop:5932 length:450 start_codon:yes stop_codon:yes gene_type:complete
MFARNTSLILKSQRGMSLVEILIALTLLAVAGTFVATNFFAQLDEGNIKAAKIQIKNLEGVLSEYKRRCHNYPSTEQGLDALVNPPTGGKECKNYPSNGFLKDGNIPNDPWENEYGYESDGRTYTIISYGQDGMEGGEGVDADISSKDI